MIIKINKKKISQNSPTYFIADIAANHDGSLARAKKLESLYKNLEVFLAKKRIEEDKIADILSRIDKIKDKKCQN